MANIGRPLEAGFDAGDGSPDGNSDTVKVGHDFEYAEIGLVVAEKNGAAIGDIDYSGADSLRQVHEELAHRHAASALGEGTTFTIFLPTN